MNEGISWDEFEEAVRYTASTLTDASEPITDGESGYLFNNKGDEVGGWIVGPILNVTT
jgi:hypothetical protein